MKNAIEIQYDSSTRQGIRGTSQQLNFLFDPGCCQRIIAARADS